MSRPIYYGGILSRGNKKYSNEVAIFNMCPASMCPSRELGLCQIHCSTLPKHARGTPCPHIDCLKCGLCLRKGNRTIVTELRGQGCYAASAERYHNVRAYRERQQKKWWWFGATSILNCIYKYGLQEKIKALRLNESGDFHKQGDVVEATYLANELYRLGIVTFCYTARSDLDWSKRGHLVVNGSGFMVDNKYVVTRRS
ncbi:MAG: hypothetical protein PVF54_09355 [Anaerolineae bacterium]|jgi:hypothetical protein